MNLLSIRKTKVNLLSLILGYIHVLMWFYIPPNCRYSTPVLILLVLGDFCDVVLALLVALLRLNTFNTYICFTCIFAYLTRIVLIAEKTLRVSYGWKSSGINA